MKNYKTIFCLVLLCVCLLTQSCYAYWVWSPQTNKWVNPIYKVFDTPKEQYDWAMAYFEEADYSKAIFEFKKILKHFPKDELAPEAKFYIAQSLANMNKWDRALEAFQKVIEIYPLNKRLGEIVEQQYLIGEKFFNKKKYYRAKEIFQKVLSNAPYSSISDVAKYKSGLCEVKVNDYLKARDEFEEFIDNYASSPYVDDATYNIGFCSYKLSALVKDYDEELIDQGITDLEHFTRKYPTSEFVPEAEKLINDLYDKKAGKLYAIAHFYEKQKKTFAAKQYYEDLVFTYAKSDWAKKANKRLKVLSEKKL
ncbi:MAG: outer membrane protein assembly factor BamD [Candidatus Omnitrophica bacterium]|nr:outer membrane protein assembly factor BamD [Candidatus Omnitrophota bacterium]